MLVHQGARQLELWTGVEAPRDVMRDAAEAALAGS
jgi:shikimate 5-dehydrogenase